MTLTSIIHPVIVYIVGNAVFLLIVYQIIRLFRWFIAKKIKAKQ